MKESFRTNKNYKCFPTKNTQIYRELAGSALWSPPQVKNICITTTRESLFHVSKDCSYPVGKKCFLQ